MLFMKMFVHMDGYNIEIAQSGKSALAMLGRKNYALIILKTKLPDITGQELVRLIRKSSNEYYQKAPILVASGNVLKEQQQNLMEAGATGFLAKPYTQPELFRAMKKLLE